MDLSRWMLQMPNKPTGVLFIDKLFFSNIGVLLLLLQLVPYCFTYGSSEKSRMVYIYTYTIFAIFASVCSVLIFGENEMTRPIYTGDCDGWMYTSNFIQVYMICIVQRMFVDTFQMFVFFDSKDSKLMQILLIFHHVTIFVGGCIGIHFSCMEYYYTSYAIAEISTVFLNLKDVYKKVWKISSKILDLINILLFVVTFFVFRIVLMPYRHITEYMNYEMCKHTIIELYPQWYFPIPLPIFLNWMAFPIMLLSYYWFFFEITPLVCRKLKKKGNPKLTD